MHWLVVFLIVPQFLFSNKISKALEARFNESEVVESPMISLHILTGFIIFCLACARFIQRLDKSNHREDNTINYAGKIIKHLNHYSLYFLLLALPATGAIGWFRGIEAFANLHVLLKSIFLLLVALHLTSTFYQQLFLKNNVLGNMLLRRK
tara:strand:+ start:312 stop:764 length:453 start_codon:yes stop_codon:yes gene_type:complete